MLLELGKYILKLSQIQKLTQNLFLSSGYNIMLNECLVPILCIIVGLFKIISVFYRHLCSIILLV